MRHCYDHEKEPYISLKRTAAPASEPLTTAEAKTYLRVDGSADDALIDRLITSARQSFERVTSRAVINQTYELTIDAFPLFTDSVPGFYRIGKDRYIILPRRPLSSVTSVKYFDDSDTERTYDASNYIVDTSGSRIVLKDDATWPIDLREGAGVVIEYIAGYGASASDVPDDIKQGLLEHVSYMYNNRGCGNSGTPDCVKEFYSRYRNYSMGVVMG